jgi:hypothetical protein
MTKTRSEAEKKHPFGARLAARRDEENLEPPRGRSLPWRQSLHLSEVICQLLYTGPGIRSPSRLEMSPFLLPVLLFNVRVLTEAKHAS